VSTYKHDDISPNSVSITEIEAIEGNRPNVIYTFYLKLTILYYKDIVRKYSNCVA